MSRRLEGQVAIVTGASSGMGKTTALQFASEGASVVVAARREEEGNATVSEIRENGGIATFIQADVARWDDVERMVERTVSEYGKLNCAFNNAGVSSRLTPRWLEVSEDDWDFTVDVNLKGVWMCMRLQIPAMLESGGGAIVNNSSLFGLRGGHSAPYTASKHGVIGLSNSAAVEFGPDGIRVNTITPGFIRTPIMARNFQNSPKMEERLSGAIPMQYVAGPETIARTVVWLCSDESSYITGQSIAVDGGVIASLGPRDFGGPVQPHSRPQ